MSKSVKTFVSVFVVAVLVLTTMGISYSYFTDNLSGDEGYLDTINSSKGKIEIAYSGGNSIEISNVNAGQDAVYSKTFSVKGTNNNTDDLKYKLYFVIDENTYYDNEISFTLTSYNPLNNGLIIPNVNNRGVSNGKNSMLLGEGYFSNADSVVHTYVIKFYLKNNNVNGKLKAHFEGLEG